MTPLLASMVYVFLKVQQQLNVVHNRMGWVLAVSYGMAACEVLLVGVIAVAAVNAASMMEQALLIFQIGTGAGLGAVASMVIHRRMREPNNERKPHG